MGSEENIMNSLALCIYPVRQAHVFCNQQALAILHNDGHTALATRIKPFLQVLNNGNHWADGGFRSLHHYYEPRSRKGIMGFSPADKVFASYFDCALNYYSRGKVADSFFYLGAALHLIQDLCVPHHSLAIALCGHRKYENWVARHYTLFAVYEKGCYDYLDPLAILRGNALQAAEHQEIVDEPKASVKVEGTRELLGLAQRSSASLLRLFGRIAMR
jgi:phospholipase C